MLNRIEPVGPVGAYKTYQVAAPVSTHFRPGSCAEAECPNHLHGWRTVIDESTDLGRQQASYVRSQSGRRYQEDRDEHGLTVFTFEAGQRCFGRHQIPLEREPLYIVRGGDWRGNPTGERRQHVTATDFVDDFGEHQERLADRLTRG